MGKAKGGNSPAIGGEASRPDARKKCYVFDTSVILTLRDNEPGAEHVSDFLYRAERGKVKVLISFISLMEVLYRVWKDEGEKEGRLAYEQIQSLPLTIHHCLKKLQPLRLPSAFH